MKTPRALVLTVRDLGHFAFAFAAAFAVTWQTHKYPLTKDALFSLAPGAATVAFRQLFPNLGQLARIIQPSGKQAPKDPTTFSAQ